MSGIFWRTLLDCRLIEDGVAFFSIAGYDPRILVGIPLEEMPPNIAKLVGSGSRFFHARVNTGEKDPRKLFFVEWEEK
jgi:hypothetical protein